ncbi:hypothetical protein EJB05_01146, partial [Eragrostis curvula]
MAPKRAAGDGAAAAARAGKRPRGAAAASGSSAPEPPPSPSRKRFRSIMIVVLFFIRPKGRSCTDDSAPPISPSRIQRIETELGLVRRDLGQVRGLLVRQHECMMNLIRALTSKVDNITGPSPNHHNHERLGIEATNQDRASAEAEELVTNEGDGKSTSTRLRFLDCRMKSPIYHGKEIKSESNEPIKIGIFDGNGMIKSGPLSKAKVEIVALEGSFPYDASDSWTAKEFDKHRASGRYGKGDVLEGEGTSVKLKKGECNLHNIRFREGSCRARKGKFIVGARVCDGQAIGGRVQEAVMDPVVVQDRRNEHNGKSHPPNLDDGVYRLEKISINGEYRKRLEKENIFTVEHFLKALHKDDDNLARILNIKKKCRDWDKMVKHAQECCLEGKRLLKSYRCAERNVVMFFNCVHHIVGAKFGSCYIACDMFSPSQQVLVDQLKRHAYDQLDGLNEDHVMTDNIPMPIDVDADAGAGTSCMPSATQQTVPGPRFAVHQVGATPAIEVLSPHAPTEPLCMNANNAPGPSSSTNPYSQHNYQAYNTQNVLPIGGIIAAEGLGLGLNESPCAIANNGPRSSFSVPDHLGTQNYQGQEQQFSDFLTDLCAQAFSFGGTDMMDMPPFNPREDDESSFLQHQADTNNYVEMQSILWQDNDTFQASTSTHTNMASAHINMALTPLQLTNLGAPGAALIGQRQAPLPNNGTAGAPESVQQQALSPQPWYPWQGNMPRTNPS